jgi:hypothetical protein
MTLFVFAIATAIGSALLFLVEPMFGRMILPRLGGTPAVWNTCVVFFQIALVGGYLYAHLSTRYLSLRRQIVLQVALFGLAALSLPISIGAHWAPAASTNPIGDVFRLLLGSVGLPFFVIAGSSPLLQRWYAAGAAAGPTPYLLYSASNFGSLVALLAYPAALEPALPLKQQSVFWAVGYALFATLMVLCGLHISRRQAPATVVPARPLPTSTTSPAAAPRVHSGRRLLWIALAFIPSTLMLSVTTFISVDIAAVPLLWVLPLALYLVTFVIAFAEQRIVSARLLGALFLPTAICLIGLVLAPDVLPILVAIALHFGAFFLIALTCHTRLAALRPPVDRLTEFYLWIAVGGALGGLFNLLVAPRLFLNVLEYPLAVVAACALRPDASTWPRHWRSRAWVVAAAVTPGILVVCSVYLVKHAGSIIPDRLSVRFLVTFAIPLLWAASLWRTPRRLSVALALMVLAGSFVRFDSRPSLYVERTFFGEHRVLGSATARLLYNGTTNHGLQSVDPRLNCEPLSYYSRTGPVGQFFRALDPGTDARIGVVGLGTATMAVYARPGQGWTFFEINPAMERIARDPAYFTFLRDCAPDARVVLGDARLSLAAVPDGSLDLLVLDAFSSDAIPVHLLTTEAVELYFRKLSPRGVLALHISNRYLRLTEVVAGVSRHERLTALTEIWVPSTADTQVSDDIFSSRCALVARRPEDLGSLTEDSRWQSLAGTAGVVWTDDYSNVFSVVGWSASGLAARVAALPQRLGRALGWLTP